MHENLNQMPLSDHDLDTPGYPEGFPSVIAERTKLESLQNTGVTDWQPWSAFIFAACVILVAGAAYAAESGLLDLLYPATYRALADAVEIGGHGRRRRAFVSHNLAAFFKTLLAAACAYPALRLFAPAWPDDFRTPLLAAREEDHSNTSVVVATVTVGDVLLVGGQLYCALYTWELCYRAGLASPARLAHHVVLLAAAQLGMALSAYPEASRDATVEYYMCLVWGAFDLAAELPVHLAIILYRTRSGGRHRHHRRWAARALGFCAAWCLCCTAAEIAVSVYLLERSWALWELSFQIATPIILCIWVGAQLSSSWRLYKLSGKVRVEVALAGDGSNEKLGDMC